MRIWERKGLIAGVKTVKKGWDLDGACIAQCNRKEAKRMSIEWVGWCYVGENKILVEGG